MVTLTPTAATAQAPGRASPCDHPYRLSVDQYVRLAVAGIVRDSEPIYLWKGQLIQKIGKGRPHITALTKLCTLLVRTLPEGWHAQQGQPLRIGDDSMPEPDLMVLRGTPDDFAKRYPTPADLVLIVEVADSSLAEDRGEKLEVYARESIAVYWLVDLVHRRVEVYTGPSGPAEAPAYAWVQAFGPEHEIPLLLDGREVGRIAVRDFLV